MRHHEDRTSEVMQCSQNQVVNESLMSGSSWPKRAAYWTTYLVTYAHTVDKPVS